MTLKQQYSLATENMKLLKRFESHILVILVTLGFLFFANQQHLLASPITAYFLIIIGIGLFVLKPLDK